uniref:Uncharacterized protein n=1 Tax=Romanomermis culicivorax TaxID=13658 RepID=A0A915IAK1_ROMCU
TRTNDLLEKLQFTIYGNDTNIKKQENRFTTALNNTKHVDRPISNHIPKRLETKRPLTRTAPMSAKLKSDVISTNSKRAVPAKKVADTIKVAIESNAAGRKKVLDENNLCTENIENLTPVSDEMNDLKREVSNLKEIVASLMINSNEKAVDSQDPKSLSSQSKNEVVCPRCHFCFDVSSSGLDKKTSSVHFSSQSDNPRKNLSDEALTNGNGGMSIIESQFRMTVFDRKSRDNVQNDQRQCDDDDFLREMIGVAEVWGRDRKVNKENEDCYEQFRIMRRVSNTNKEFSSRRTQSQLESLLTAAHQNPNLKKKLESLAMHYLPDSQLTRVANTRLESNRVIKSPVFSDCCEQKMLDYPKKSRSIRSNAIKNRPFHPEYKESEQNDEEFFSLCSQKYLQRHGLLPKSSLSSSDDCADDDCFDRNRRRPHNALTERNECEYGNADKFIEIDDDEDDFLTIPRH